MYMKYAPYADQFVYKRFLINVNLNIWYMQKLLASLCRRDCERVGIWIYIHMAWPSLRKGDFVFISIYYMRYAQGMD